MRKQDRTHIGTSGWHSGHWKGSFYAEEYPSEEFLEFYQSHFDTVEINNSFYQLPKRKTVEAWRKAVPSGFIFFVKESC